jgi:hypothetical protein
MDESLASQAPAQAGRRDDVRGDFVVIDDQKYCRIENYDRLPPFFMSLLSASNHWLFLSSNGGLTAGRRDADNALFPYSTEDRIHDAAGHTGARAILRVERNQHRALWEPFSRHGGLLQKLTRNLYKNVCGSRLIFEEINHDLELTFRYAWMLSDRFGFVKRSELVNHGSGSARLDVLDGIENILPWGLTADFQRRYSCLGDAYKQSEFHPGAGFATYALSALPGDSAEPAEALRATACWSAGLDAATRLVSSRQLDAFRQGEAVQSETRICGRRGAFFVADTLQLAPGDERDWLIVADVDQGPVELAALRRTLASEPRLEQLVLDDAAESTRRLAAIVAGADGLQKTGDRLGSAHHFANVLFNVMRGGIFEAGYTIFAADLRQFVRVFNRDVFERHSEFLDGLAVEVGREELLSQAAALGDRELHRLLIEYLPLSFSRRHGDPSRPWNEFAINVEDRDGSRIRDYQGNWRDIFQNWEALCLSFPEYLESCLARFVNTSTADGYNPYRVVKTGYDWEVPEIDDPWAHFGYWGDHQLIYLLKFLEHSSRYHPGSLESMLDDPRFVHADVPYDIRPHDELLADPRNSIRYSTAREAKIAARVDAIGFDGRYLPDAAGEPCHATLTEKLLIPLLAKLSGFAAGAGFWLNTQRPEWNDANNALAGFGASMVTLYYGRRYVSFCLDLLENADVEELQLAEEVARWFEGTFAVLEAHRGVLADADVDEATRKEILDGLGRIAETYRSGLYAEGLSGRGAGVRRADLLGFLRLTRDFFDHTIELNRRDDGLYHAYNILDIGEEGIGVTRLNAMLEGQVAVLSSGTLSAGEAVSVLTALRQSAMYREDQHSYLLYPDRVLPAFLDKNNIPGSAAEQSALFRELVGRGNTELVEQDIEGGLHFNGSFRSVRDVRDALDGLRTNGYEALVDAEEGLVCDIFESVFDHRKFTGRSGAFYGYEGLGCIYWHMVSKLLVAVQENCFTAASQADPALAELVVRYYDVRSGLGFNKRPEAYGAFPTDPYSHTPGFGGARQPGMTGQVKEEILTRLGELGVAVQGGRIHFDPLMLRPQEFLDESETFDYYDVDGGAQELKLEPGSLAFTYCQVPVVYRDSEDAAVTIHLADGTQQQIDGLGLDEATSREIFTRSGRIRRLEVALSPRLSS